MSNDKTVNIDEAPQPPARLDEEKFTELAGAVHRMQELQAYSILTKEKEIEKRALEGFILQGFIRYAGELLGAWVTINREYRPIMQAFALVLERSQDILAVKRHYQNEANKPAPEQEKKP